MVFVRENPSKKMDENWGGKSPWKIPIYLGKL